MHLWVWVWRINECALLCIMLSNWTRRFCLFFHSVVPMHCRSCRCIVHAWLLLSLKKLCFLESLVIEEKTRILQGYLWLNHRMILHRRRADITAIQRILIATRGVRREIHASFYWERRVISPVWVIISIPIIPKVTILARAAIIVVILINERWIVVADILIILILC